MQTFAPLTFGQVKANKDAISALLAATGAVEATEAAAAFLAISDSSVNLDSAAPGEIQAAAFDLYKATFSRPESAAQA